MTFTDCRSAFLVLTSAVSFTSRPPYTEPHRHLWPTKGDTSSSRAGVDGLERGETLCAYRKSRAASSIVKPMAWSLSGGQNTDYVTTPQAYQQDYTGPSMRRQRLMNAKGRETKRACLIQGNITESDGRGRV